jgi:hypothetical protein
MLNECDHLVGPCCRIVECRVVAVGEEKEAHCSKGSALVSLLESVCLRDPVQQRYP